MVSPAVFFSLFFFEGKPLLARYTSTLGEMFISNLLHLFDGDINITGTDYSGSSSNSDSSSTSCSAESSTESDGDNCFLLLVTERGLMITPLVCFASLKLRYGATTMLLLYDFFGIVSWSFLPTLNSKTEE